MKSTIAFMLLFATLESAPALPTETGFLTGCWAGESGDRYIEEQYGSNFGGTLLGSVKITRDGRVVFFEFLRIRADADGSWLQPWPNGQNKAPRFKLIEREADKLVFENAQHDFPRRITYRLLTNGQLLTRVTGEQDGAAHVEEYVTLPRACSEI